MNTQDDNIPRKYHLLSADGNATLDTFSSTGWIIASGIGFVLILAWMTNKLYRLKPPIDLLEGLDDIA